MAEYQTAVARPPADSMPRRALVGLAVVSLGATLPIALTDVGRASARPLVTGRERASVLDDNVWAGRSDATSWTWVASFPKPIHLGLVRAHLGASPTSGVPTVFHWETRSPAKDAAGAATCTGASDGVWKAVPGADQSPILEGDASHVMLAQPTRRSWFVDADACGLRLVIDKTNAGPPVVRDVQAIESARDVLRDGAASDDGSYPGFDARGAVDGAYATRWAGAPGKSRWTLRVDLAKPTAIDRVRLVLGFDATSVPRGGSGRNYAVAWSPVHYSLEASEDGIHFTPIATEPTREGGAVLPLRRRLVTLTEPRTVQALRLVMSGATGASGRPEAGGVPVVREMSAFRADDARPVLAAPWVLSVNANPSAESHVEPGGELTNDAYWTKFLQRRFTLILSEMRRDDRYDRSLGNHGEPLDAPPHDEAGELLEAIEGDDPQLGVQLLSQSSPPPITILSGSDDWDYAGRTAPDPKNRRKWHWDPLHDARGGGMGQLAPAVRQRVAPMLGFCGGAQLLALLEATPAPGSTPADDRHEIDQVLRRTSGQPIRGFAPAADVERAWPGETQRPRALVQFQPGDPLFADVAGPQKRSSTQAFPESHADAVRAAAFLPGGPLSRFEVLATSAFCGSDVVPGGPGDGWFANPSGPGFCETVPEAFRSRDPGWPIVGAQFHAEQHDFLVPGAGDPPESVADARLFFAAAYEQMVDAYVRLAP